MRIAISIGQGSELLTLPCGFYSRRRSAPDCSEHCEAPRFYACATELRNGARIIVLRICLTERLSEVFGRASVRSHF